MNVPLLIALRTAQRRPTTVSPLRVFHRIDGWVRPRRHFYQLSVCSHFIQAPQPPQLSCHFSLEPTHHHTLTQTSAMRLCSFHTHSSHFQTSNTSPGEISELDDISYHKIADETLDELASFFEDLGDSGLCSKEYDASLASGVLTVNFGDHGTYVINKQSPNKQIWLSSPKSGPKRYDIIDGQWRYSHDGMALYDLLTTEISEMLGMMVDFSELTHAHISTDGSNWA